MQQTGFTGIHISIEDAYFIFAHDEEWWSSLWSRGIRGRLERLEALVLAQVKADMPLVSWN